MDAGEWDKAIRQDWLTVRSSGLKRFNARKLKVLPKLFALNKGDAEAIRDRLLGLLLNGEAADVVEARAVALAVREETLVRLALFRADNATEDIDDLSGPHGARDAANKRLLKPRKNEELFRKGGNDAGIMVSLVEATVAQYPLPPDQEPAAGPQRMRSVKVAALRRGARDPDSAKAFWSRDSTECHRKALAELDDLTIYAGADGASDVGQPIHRELLRSLLSDEVARHARNFADGDVKQALARFADTVPQAWLGSVLRELYDPPYTIRGERDIEDAVRSYLSRMRTSGGFSARGITYLAFAMAELGRTVRVMSAHFDEDLWDAAANRRRHYEDFTDIDYVEDDVARAEGVPLIRVHGQSRDGWIRSLVLGENDYLANPSIEDRWDPAVTARHARLVELLAEGPFLFVGTSLEDPALLSALATTADTEHPRYAIVLPSDVRAPVELSADAWAVQRWLLATRFVHLGVVPVVVDFPTQVSQFLREVGDTIKLGSHYEPYKKRIVRWAGCLEESCGLRLADGVECDKATRAAWDGQLQAIREELSARALSRGYKSETFQVDAWLRNPARRELVLVGSTQAGRTAEPAGLLDGSRSRLECEAFRSGQSIDEISSDPGGSMSTAFPVVQYTANWHRLPVGVVTVRSDKNNGALHALACRKGERGEFEDRAGRRLEEHLLPTAQTGA